MGSAADGSALVLTGLVVSAQAFEIRGDTLIAVFLKNLLQPAVALGLALLIHLILNNALRTLIQCYAVWLLRHCVRQGV